MNAMLLIMLSNAVLVIPFALAIYLIGKRVQRPALIHCLWVLLLVKLITPPIVQVPIGNLLPQVATADSKQDNQTLTNPDSVPRTSVSGPLAFGDETKRSRLAQPQSPESTSENGLKPSSPETHTTPVAKSDLRALSINWARFSVIFIAVIWGLGAIFTFASTVLQVRRLSRIVAQSSIAPDSLRQLMKAAGDRIGSRRIPELRLVDVKVAPLAVAIWNRRFILLPTKLVSTLNDAQVTAVLSHELAHFQRRDHWVRWIEVLVSIVYWWNPLIPWIKNQLEEREEEACDALAIQGNSMSAECYANTLLRTLDYLAEPPAAKTMSVASAMAQIVRTQITAHSRTSAYASRLNLLFQSGIPKSISLRGYAFAVVFAFLVLPWAAGNQPDATTPFSFLFASANVNSNSSRDETMVADEEYAGRKLPKLEVHGTVVDENGDAVANARVRNEFTLGQRLTVQTDSSGKFRLSSIDVHTLVAESSEGLLGISTGGSLSPTIVCKSPHIIKCKVLDSDDNPVQGATVKTMNERGLRLSQLTDSRGEVELNVPADASIWWLFAFKSKVGSDYHETYRSFPPQEFPALPNNVTLRLTKGNDIKVKVMDSAGQPIKGMLVAPSDISSYGKMSYAYLDGSDLRQATDEAGGVTFDWLPAEAFVAFYAFGSNYEARGRINAKTAVENQELVITASRFSIIRGRITNPDGKPAVGMVVNVAGRQASSVNLVCGESVTDSDGRYEMKVGSGQKFLVAASDDRLAARSTEFFDLDEGEVKEGIDLQLENASLITGRITNQKGEPVCDDSCTLSHIEDDHDEDNYHCPQLDRWAKLNQNGKYSFSVAPGKYLLRYPNVLDRELIEVTDQEEVVRDKQIQLFSKLNGRTLDANGKTIGNTWVFGSYVGECGFVGFQTSSDPTGEFEVSRFDEEMGIVAMNQEHNLFDIKLVDPQQSSVDFEMKPGGQLTGTLLNEDGKPEIGAWVQCHPSVYIPYSEGLKTKTDERGRYVFRGLPIDYGGRLHFHPRTKAFHRGPDYDPIKDQTMVDLGEFQLAYDDER